MSHEVAFRLTDNTDPEERLEEAALWKAFYDHYGPDRVLSFKGLEPPDDALPVFGRTPRSPLVPCRNPVPGRLDYWTDHAFLSRCNREFHVVRYEESIALVREMQARGKRVFLKSTAPKHFIGSVGATESPERALGDMAYSFMDGGPLLMVQEFVDILYEYRFFVVDREIVTSSPNMVSLTPLDYPLPHDTVYRTPSSRLPEVVPGLFGEYCDLVRGVAADMDTEHACVDVAVIAGKPGVVEFNPMQIGQIGLFACDVRALAAASERLVRRYRPEPPFALADDAEAPFLD